MKQMTEAAVERTMKLQGIILRAMAKPKRGIKLRRSWVQLPADAAMEEAI